MIGLRLSALLLIVSSAFCYDEKYDKLDVDKIINDDELFNSYIQCLLDKGPCTVEYSKDFRELVPEVIATACAKCSPLQRGRVRKTVTALQTKRPDDFLTFRAKYDPKGEYEKAFSEFMAAKD